MKEYIFSKQELDILKYIKANNPKKIWNNHILYIFDYEKFYVKLEIECAEKFSLDDHLEQYVMIAKIEHVNEIFQANESSNLISLNENILKIEIVRTLLFFNKHREIKGTKNPYFISQSSQINPNLKIDGAINAERNYLVDVGLLITLENGKFLNCFIIENEDDFSVNEFLYEMSDLKNDKREHYEFIKID